MSRSYDPSFRAAVDWVEACRSGEGDGPRPSNDPAFLAAEQWVDAFLDAAQVLPLPEPPQELRGRLRASFARHRTLHTEPPLEIELLALVSDTRRENRSVGVRGVATGIDSPIQFGFQGRSATVLVEVNRRSDNTADLTGQVVPRDGTSDIFSVTAHSTFDPGLVTESNGDGEFRFVGVGLEATVIEVTNGTLLLRFDVDLRI